MVPPVTCRPLTVSAPLGPIPTPASGWPLREWLYGGHTGQAHEAPKAKGCCVGRSCPAGRAGAGRSLPEREHPNHRSAGLLRPGRPPRHRRSGTDDRRRGQRQALSTFMGHANISITLDRYGHPMPGSEAEAAKLLEPTWPLSGSRLRTQPGSADTKAPGASTGTRDGDLAL
jgi:hypothetical protein